MLSEVSTVAGADQGEYRWYLYEPGSNKPLALISGGQLYFYQLDQLGTLLSLTDSDNNIVWQASYSVFGNATVSVYKIDNPLRFQGQYYDSESGLHYNHFRYYDPHTGRFISQDPIGLLGGINHYQYAPNHVNWADPLGLSCKENAWNAFQKNTKGHFSNSSAAAASYQKMKEVRALDNAGRPDRQFVMTKSQMDDILVRTGGDMALIEAELGIPAGDWAEK